MERPCQVVRDLTASAEITLVSASEEPAFPFANGHESQRRECLHSSGPRWLADSARQPYIVLGESVVPCAPLLFLSVHRCTRK